MQLKYLYHGTSNDNYNKLLNSGSLAHEYNYPDLPYEVGLYLTDNFEKARIHGQVILKIEFQYTLHNVLLLVCEYNANDRDGDIDELEVKSGVDCCVEYLEASERECFVAGGILISNVIDVYTPDGSDGTTKYIDWI